jgi:hypothetical protein
MYPGRTAEHASQVLSRALSAPGWTCRLLLTRHALFALFALFPKNASSSIRDAAAAHLRSGGLQPAGLGRRKRSPRGKSPGLTFFGSSFFCAPPARPTSCPERTLHSPRCRPCAAPGRRTATRGSSAHAAFLNIPYFSPLVHLSQPTSAPENLR